MSPKRGSRRTRSVAIVGTGRDDGAHVEATLGGLRAGVEYRLFVVTVGGETEFVTQLMEADGRATVAADLKRSPRDLAFFTVTQVDGAVVLSVRVTAAPSTP